MVDWFFLRMGHKSKENSKKNSHDWYKSLHTLCGGDPTMSPVTTDTAPARQLMLVSSGQAQARQGQSSVIFCRFSCSRAPSICVGKTILNLGNNAQQREKVTSDASQVIQAQQNNPKGAANKQMAKMSQSSKMGLQTRCKLEGSGEIQKLLNNQIIK